MNALSKQETFTNCPSCGSTNPTSARFCNSCGKPLSQSGPIESEIDPFIGKLIGHRFIVQKKIGEGGMGVVYRGIQTGIERPVALKLLHTEYARDATLLERFKNEAATASMLTHPNTVTIFDFGSTEDGSLYIAMEFLEGTELSALIKKEGALEWHRACDIAQQICHSLEEAHHNRIIHRDLKPDNIMLSNRGSRKDIVKVLDFGIAKIKTRENATQLTAAGEIFGTPEYMSPEQIKGEILTPASDIYSLGIMLYHMLTGNLPFSAPQPMALLVKHLADKPTPFHQANSTINVPSELETMVMLSLSKSAKERPESMADIARFLKNLVKTQHETIHIESNLSKTIADKSQKVSIRDLQPPEPNPSLPGGLSSQQHQRIPVASQVAPSPVAQKEPPAQSVEAINNQPDRSQQSIIQEPSNLGGAITIGDNPRAKHKPFEVPDTSFPSVNRSKDDILRELIKKMKRKRDFPAVSKHVSELNAKVASSTISARQLANVILKDYSLTNKLLKLINSPYYGQVRGKITTVSRAVVLMGFDQVKQAALGLLMFDHFCMQAGPQAQALSNSMLASLLSGLTARYVGGRVTGVAIEEAFVCAMMRSLGKNLVAFYFPTKYQQITHTVKRQKFSEERASVAVLGVTFEELAQALAKEWCLPESILQSMAKLPDGPLTKPGTVGEKLRNVSAFSNELTYMSTHGSLDTRLDDMEALLHKYKETFSMTPEEVEQLYQDLSEKLEDYSEAMNLGFKNSPLIKRIMAWSGQTVSNIPDALTVSPSSEHTVRPLISYTPEKLAKQERAARERILLQGIDEVAAAVARHEDMNNIISIVLETMFRGLKLSRVIFALYDPKTDTIRARSGFGDEIDSIIKQFYFKPSRSGDLFTTAMAQGRDMFVDLGTKGYMSKLPTWYREKVLPLPAQLILYPVLVNSFAVGLFYGDVSTETEKLSRRHLSHMIKLRGHATKSIKRALPKIRRR